MLIRLVFSLILSCFMASSAAPIVLRHSSDSVSVDPATLKMVWQRNASSPGMELSAAAATPWTVANVKTNRHEASWQIANLETTLTMQISDRGLLVHVRSQKTGTFTFPVIRATAKTRGWILPLFEGVYVPAGDAKWNSFLIERGEMNTTADFTLPFLGVDYGDHTVTYIFTNQFNNSITFEAPNKKELQARFSHEFTRNQPVKEYGILIKIGNASPIEPANLYRQWIIGRGEFVSLKDKIRKTPEAEKLGGAIHAYVWGEELLSTLDILDWKRFARELILHSAAPNRSPAKSIWERLQPSARDAVKELSEAEWPGAFLKSAIVEELNKLLVRPDFYDETAWRTVSVPREFLRLSDSDRAKQSVSDLCRFNAAIFAAAFPKVVANPQNWGNGTSPNMITSLTEGGIERCSLTSAGWDGFVRRPETVELARKAGFLIGTYDSFHSIHHPEAADTWATAQFDLELYETGGIVNADGAKRHGFKKKGFLLSPAAARPYVEKRVTNLMTIFRANSWFVDCDGFGEFFDDYSETHPATQLSDMRERNSRMAWIRDTFGAVIGTEGCSAGVASTVHFAHGVLTPVIGWGDPDLNQNKQSPYYLGNYYPPDEPQVFFKAAEMKENFRYIYYEPRFRLPLFQTVFHDSVVATHHWSFGSLKTKTHATTVQLLELLYNVPPLYHWNLREFKKRKEMIKRHYDFFSPLHRKAWLLPVTEFKWLSPDRTVQQVVFGDELEMTANFGGDRYSPDTINLPGRSVAARWRDTGKIMFFTSDTADP